MSHCDRDALQCFYCKTSQAPKEFVDHKTRPRDTVALDNLTGDSRYNILIYAAGHKLVDERNMAQTQDLN